MQYQLPNGKVIYLSIEQFLEMTDQDIQFLMSIDHGVHIVDPFTGSAVEDTTYKEFDFSYLPNDENEENDAFNDISLDDIIASACLPNVAPITDSVIVELLNLEIPLAITFHSKVGSL